MTTDHGDRRLWFGLLAAPAAWSAEGLFGWYVGGHICGAFSVGAARVLVGTASVAMLALAAGGLLTAWRSWQAISAAPHARADRVEFMSFGGVVVSATFAIGIVWFGLNGWLVDGCGGMR